MKNFNKSNKLMNIFERNSNYELEDKFKTDAKERQQMCRFCSKKFKSNRVERLYFKVNKRIYTF